MPNQVTWKPIRPELTIDCMRSASSGRCYHESWYEIISLRVLDADDLERLDQCGLLGIGQAYYLESTETIIDIVSHVVVDRRTGQVIECNCGGGEQGEGLDSLPHTEACPAEPRNWHPIDDSTTTYEYQRYVVRRICDSGD